MNVAKNWALTIMLIALAFAHFSSELLLKEQMIIPVKKNVKPTLVISTQNWSILAKFPPKNPAKLVALVFVFPRHFPWNRPIFLRICLWKSLEIWHFSTKIPRNRPIFLRILTFFLQKYHKSADFSVNFDFLPAKIPWKYRPIFPRICPWKSRENFAFFPQNIRSPVIMMIDQSLA